MSLDVADAARAAVQGSQLLGLAALIVFAAGAAVTIATPAGRYLGRLALRGINGSGGRWSGVVRGTAVVTAAAASLIVCFAFEEEIRAGPGRVISQMLPDGQPEALWVLSPDTDHFMNTSSIDADQARVLQAAVQADAVVVPFTIDLTEVADGTRTQTSLVVRLPVTASPDPQQMPAALGAVPCSGQPTEQPCWPSGDQLVGDPDAPFGVGVRVEAGGETAVVAGTTTGRTSMLNRSVWFGVYEAAPAQFYGLLVLPAPGADLDEVQDGLRASAPGLEVLDTTALLANNARFWTGNGTVLMLLLMVVILAFSTMAQFGHRGVESQLARTQMATLRATGMYRTQLLQTSAVRSLGSGLLATVAGWAAAAAIVFVANGAVVGFDATIRVWMPPATAGILIASDFAAVAFLLWRDRRTSLVANLNAK